MPMPDKTLIEPDAVGSKAPLKKSTVAWAVGLLMTFALVGYYAPRLAAKSKPSVADEPAATTARQNNGTPDQIDAEFKRALGAIKPAGGTQSPAHAPDPAQAGNGKPVPDAVVSQQPTGAGSENASVTPGAGAPVNLPLPGAIAPQPVPKSPAARGAGRDVDPDSELDASARTSKSILFDQSESGNVMKTSLNAPGAERRRTSARDGQDETDAAGAYVRDSRERADRAIAAQARGSRVTDPNREWLREFNEVKPARAIKPTLVQSPYTLLQGKVIPAVLAKRLNSDLPGDITAFTTIDIYDSLSGRHLLIPKGSQLVGEYSNQVRAGQSRMMFAFSRIVLPNGLSYDLPGNKGQDLSGASGVSGDVDNHYFQRFFNGIVIAVLASRVDASAQAQVPASTMAYGGQTTTSAAGQVLLEIAKSDLSRTKDIPPTITVPQGTRINVQVAADMEFPPSFAEKKQ